MSTATIEGKIAHIIRKEGKIFNISSLAHEYKQHHGESMPSSKGKLSVWIQQFTSLTVHKRKDAIFVGLKETSERISTTLSNNGGSLSVSDLSGLYEKAYNEIIPFPNKLLRLHHWLEGFDSLSVSCESNSTPMIALKDLKKMDKKQKTKTLPRIISNESDLELVLSKKNDNKGICMHCEILKDETIIIVICGCDFCAVIDCESFGKNAGMFINNIIDEKRILVHDLYQHVQIFNRIGISPNNLFIDTQLIMELLTGKVLSTLSEVGNHFKIPTRLDKCAFRNHAVKRPLVLNDSIIKNATDKAKVLMELQSLISESLNESQMKMVTIASQTRAKQTLRDHRFILDEDYIMASYELAVCLYSKESISQSSRMIIHNEVESVLNLLPDSMKDQLNDLGTEYITDLSLDNGRRPHCWWKGERKWLVPKEESNPMKKILDKILVNDENLVQLSDLKAILSKVGHIGSDNRAGIERALHRISCIRNRKSDVIGVTIRFGRHISGNVDMIRDLLCGPNQGSILFLGEPGSGKTTIVREATKILSETNNVFVVDTSNEIAGDGDLPHPCIGHARRLMVTTLREQANVMVECVQNHTPSIMVIDEIGRKAEVLAAQTSKHRGVRMIASAHGDFRSLLKNRDLVGLLGGLETLTLGDKEAEAEAARKGFKEKNKQKTQRAGAPIFEIIIELRRGMHNEWVITTNSAAAVDDILDGEKYHVQRRIRDAETGTFYIRNDKL